MREKLLKIIEHFGVIHQLKYFQSEIFELNEAILYREHPNDIARPFIDFNAKINNKTSPNIEHIAEEIADCYVMLEQFKFYYGIEDMDVKEIMNKKIDRTIKRIKEGYYEKK